MADQNLKQATCPVCGYTASAGDIEALESDMQEHMRLMHNQVAAADPASIDLKQTGQKVSDGVTVGPGTTRVVLPGANSGNAGQFSAPAVDVDIPDKD